MTLRNILLAGTALGAAAFLAVPAQAGSKDCCGDVDALKQQINDLQQKVDDLAINYGNKIKDLESRKGDVITTFKNGRPGFRSADGSFKLDFRGRFHMDAGSYFNVDQGIENIGGRDDDINFRRARFGVKGHVWNDWKYALIFDFGGSDDSSGPALHEASLTYAGIDNVGITWGASKPKLTFADSVSSNDVTFLEDPTAATLMASIGGGSSRQMLGVTYEGEQLFLAVSQTWGEVGDNEGDLDGGENLLGRIAFVQPLGDTLSMQVGASGAWKYNSDGSFRFRDRQELRLDAGRLLTMNNITSVDDVYGYGPDLTLAAGPFRASAEYYWYKVNRDTGSDYDFDAWYAEAAWLITGESYKFDGEGGMKGVSPANPFDLAGSGSGAFEAAVRYSDTDLSDVAGTAFDSGDALQQKIWTFGLNWYPNKNIAFKANYQIVDLEDGAGNDAGFEAVALRTQFKF
ncbi:phosphate-selective porin OprO/OprP [Parvibaculum indicum]|uniref:OprO/OprP family phosphate-selective porin n=1 Tax=Parvibaculum indicum TaxID=562969 RepID=UPI001422BFC5|nr:porin [Parvibaculum indicum]NIJ42107.1 phosphate-selective porin OprO/OprP [Parvibaculum indicum]